MDWVIRDRWVTIEITESLERISLFETVGSFAWIASLEMVGSLKIIELLEQISSFEAIRSFAWIGS